MEGEALRALGAMWALTLIALVFVILRLYTRVGIIKTFGADDAVYTVAFILLLLYTVFIQLSANYGFGQNMFEIKDIENAIRAVLLEVVGQTFAIIGMAVAKWSLGLFLLRLVNVNMIRYKVAIWTAMVGLMLTSISVVFIYWLQCSPPAYLWDRRIPGGSCPINAIPAAFTLSIFCIFVDIFFAIIPWILLWNLSMKRRDKIIIAGSMSLGIFAGACGIKRTLELPNLAKQNYLRDTVRAIVWSAAEISVTMICIGIPVCRPLYKRIYQNLKSNYVSESSGPLSLPAPSTVGGGGGPAEGEIGLPVRPARAWIPRRNLSFPEIRPGFIGPRTKTGQLTNQTGDDSNEEARVESSARADCDPMLVRTTSQQQSRSL